MTQQRAQQITAEHESRFGSDISACMTPAEATEIRRMWLALPYNSTFRSTVYAIASGRI